ncbi:hypothetical protein [Burkholderia sp. Ac-20379]|uniref:hypothetical protein n=1 Tax=Burkholderia sp. Ac-20379 TaxID=2703900 RepID=UPI001982065A|nr:hypothetical protein [Burkholderia sp. Ac-20379]MBN3722886.1 hypothetical protein [Burkholderia sp. Ac-20379]
MIVMPCLPTLFVVVDIVVAATGRPIARCACNKKARLEARVLFERLTDRRGRGAGRCWETSAALATAAATSADRLLKRPATPLAVRIQGQGLGRATRGPANTRNRSGD